MNRPSFLLAVLVIQGACALLFLGSFLVSVLGLIRLPWVFLEIIEIGAAAGLVLGSVTGWIVLRRSLARTARVEEQLRAASGAFYDLMEERFTDWRLTPAERDVALFAIKGMSISDIAALRDTSEGTVKAQTNAIYRKAGVSGRPQLLSLFIEDLIDGSITPGTGAPPGENDAA